VNDEDGNITSSKGDNDIVNDEDGNGANNDDYSIVNDNDNNSVDDYPTVPANWRIRSYRSLTKN
jgi:hypothetical protein